MWRLSRFLIVVCAITLIGSPARSDEPASAAYVPAPPVHVTDGAFIRTANFPGTRRRMVLPEATAGNAQSPKAIHFVGEHDRTYFVYADSRAHPMLGYYDHRAREWAPPVQVGTSSRPLNAHGNPALAITPDGTLHVFYGAHTSADYVRSSGSPESITDWGPEVITSDAGTYHNVWTVGERLVLWQRERLGDQSIWGIRTSDDLGRTWSALAPVFHGDRVRWVYPNLFVDSAADPPAFHLFWLTFSYADGWQDMYHARSTDGAQSFHTLSGTDIDLPIVPDGGDLVYRGITHGWQNEIVLDPQGRPGLLFVTGGKEIADENVAMFASWEGEWQVSPITEVSSRYNHGTALVDSAGAVRVYLASGAELGGDITEWRSEDGGITWRQSGRLTDDSTVIHNYPEPVINPTAEFEVFWCSTGIPTGRIYAWGRAGTLTPPTR